MNPPPLKVAYLTAGAAGMYCGSCMHDNTLAAAMSKLGVDVQLIPAYTPIRTDEHDVSVDRVFFGGVNVYLQQRFSLFRHVPAFLDRVLNQRWLLKLVTSRASQMDYRELGALTVSMLRGEHGYQRKELRRLCRWLQRTSHPDLVNLSNMLIGGCVREIKRTLGMPVLVTLQGDDVFLDELPEPFRSQAFDEIRRLVADVDGFLVHSRYYRDFMADYFRIPLRKFYIVPLGIDLRGFPAEPPAAAREASPPTIGYLARLAPEKGLQILVDAFLRLKQRPGFEQARLHIAGWLGSHQRAFADAEFAKLKAAGWERDFRYFGSVDRPGKLDFLRGLDVLSVPTVYKDPKGLYALEAIAAGVPVVQPAHGAFPEMIESTGGGFLAPPNDPAGLADALQAALSDRPRLQAAAQVGFAAVHSRRNAEIMAAETLAIYGQFLRSPDQRSDSR